jgi:hypothetical protein
MTRRGWRHVYIMVKVRPRAHCAKAEAGSVSYYGSGIHLD